MSSLFAHSLKNLKNVPFLQVVRNTVSHDRSLPDRLLVQPIDIWPGDEERGYSLCAGVLDFKGDTLEMRRNFWDTESYDSKWDEYIHGFSYLRDLKAVGSSEAASLGRSMILDWIYNSQNWIKNDIIYTVFPIRFNNFISHYDFFFGASDSAEHDMFMACLLDHVHQLKMLGQHRDIHEHKFEVAKAMAYALVALPNMQNIFEKYKKYTNAVINENILADGSHLSRCPERLLEALCSFLDMCNALTAGGYDVADNIADAIERMGEALRFFLYHDKHLAVFNGGQEGDERWIDSALNQSRRPGNKIRNSLRAGGFERISQGRSLLLLDLGYRAPRPYTQLAHRAPLSFEMSYGKERLFVSCGSHPTSGEWEQSLKLAHAHNTLCFDRLAEYQHNAQKTKTADDFMPSVLRSDKKDLNKVEVSYAGYQAQYGIVHKRILQMDMQGGRLTASDRIESDLRCQSMLEGAMLRFHLHPRVLASMVNDGREILLRLPSGIGFRFYQTGGVLGLENSIYLGQGAYPRKTKQLTVALDVNQPDAQVNWCLQREGL